MNFLNYSNIMLILFLIWLLNIDIYKNKMGDKGKQEKAGNREGRKRNKRQEERTDEKKIWVGEDLGRERNSRIRGERVVEGER